MSTFDALKARGIRVGDAVRTPPHGAHTIGRVTRLYFGYAMVRYADRSMVSFRPEALTKATAEEQAGFAAVERRSPLWDA
jgi:hypothetical protein